MSSQETSDQVDSTEVDRMMSALRIVMAFDGEQFQIKAVLEAILTKREPMVEWLKLAAMCSAFSQPNDQMSGFRIIKQRVKELFGNKEHWDVTVSKDPPSEYMKNCKEVLKDIPKASRRTFTLFFEHLPRLLNSAFTIDHVTAGWKRTGLCPFDPVRMLQYWPKWNDLSAEEGVGLTELVRELMARAREKGYLRDEEIVQKLRGILPESAFTVGHRDILSYAVNRWRATWLNHSGTMAKRKEKEDADRAKKEAAAAKKRGRGGGRKVPAAAAVIAAAGTGAPPATGGSGSGSAAKRSRGSH
jgi:hypothetical protein